MELLPLSDSNHAPCPRGQCEQPTNQRKEGACAKQKNMLKELTDKSSDTYQRNAWEKLRTSIYILINKVNAVNIGTVRKDLLRLNILRGKGLFCQFITQAQIASINDTHIYASLVAAISLLFPCIGELLLTRCILQFKKAYCQNEKPQCLASVIFIAHLINHSVADEDLAIELLKLLIKSPTLVSIELSCAILEICGKKVSQVYKKGMDDIFDLIHNVLNDEQLDEMVQNKIKMLLKLQENGFKVKQFDLVPDDFQRTQLLTLDSELDPQDAIDYYQYDPDYETNEKKYKLSKILTQGSGSDTDDNEK